VLNYGSDNQNTIQEIHRVSRPGQRRYVHTTAIPKIRSGLGVAILSTSRGVMSDRQARKLGIGGELLCEVW
jgi:small subunit ribosomal protein S8